ETVVFLFVGSGLRAVACCGGSAALVSRTPPLDAAHVPNHRRRHPAAFLVGNYYLRIAPSAPALFPRPGSGAPEFDQRSSIAFRQHLAFAAPASGRLHGWRRRRADYRRRDWMVIDRSLLGHAVAQSGRTHSSHGLDSFGHGAFALRALVKG